MTGHEDVDYIFEEIRTNVFDLYECIEQVKKLLDSTTKHTKAGQFYFTLWSTLVAQANLMDEMRTYKKVVENNRIRLETLERLLLMVLRRDESLAGDAIFHRIIDALKQNKEEA